ncbi:MAG: hypothetical protein IIB00_07695 [candidate division Zixibacteria bacterium]|nr:hypothetical protein [candidate division Zixibacteria bacterium]
MKFILKQIIIFSAVFFALDGCDKEVTGFGHKAFDYFGVVLDSADVQPIDSVLITITDTLIASPLHATDSMGRFSFGLINSPDDIFFMKAGYLTTTFLGDTASRLDSLTILLVRK